MQRTKIAVVVLLAVAAAGTAALTANAASRGSAPPCVPKITTIGGHKAGVNCGPATATFHISGKTYTFRNGFCQQSKAAGPGLLLDLGTAVLNAKGNADQPNFNMTIVSRLHSAYGSGTVSAYYGGRHLGYGLVKVGGKIPSRGTFTGTVVTGGKFTGSWNCHGVVWQGP